MEASIKKDPYVQKANTILNNQLEYNKILGNFGNTLLSRNTHRIIYIFFISCLAFSISLGKFPMSLSLIGLFLNWIIELDFKRKWKKIIDRNYLPLLLAGLFIVELFWLPFSEDLLIGLNVLRIKLPLLLLPIIVGSASSFKTKEWRTIISAFFVGLLISTVWVYLVSIDMLPTKKNIRND